MLGVPWREPIVSQEQVLQTAEKELGSGNLDILINRFSPFMQRLGLAGSDISDFYTRGPSLVYDPSHSKPIFPLERTVLYYPQQGIVIDADNVPNCGLASRSFSSYAESNGKLAHLLTTTFRDSSYAIACSETNGMLMKIRNFIERGNGYHHFRGSIAEFGTHQRPEIRFCWDDAHLPLDYSGMTKEELQTYVGIHAKEIEHALRDEGTDPLEKHELAILLVTNLKSFYKACFNLPGIDVDQMHDSASKGLELPPDIFIPPNMLPSLHPSEGEEILYE